MTQPLSNVVMHFTRGAFTTGLKREMSIVHCVVQRLVKVFMCSFSMCGIIVAVGAVDHQQFDRGLRRIAARGPDEKRVMNNGCVKMGFARLAINGLNQSSMQPFNKSSIFSLCNGEIFNHKELEAHIGVAPTSGSDCEFLIDGFEQWGFAELCRRLDAEFALIINDFKTGNVWIARDPYGVRPLFWGRTLDDSIVFSSELKGIYDICVSVEQFVPGNFMCIDYFLKKPVVIEYTNYHPYLTISTIYPHYDKVRATVRNLLEDAVKKRVMTCDPTIPVCCLLSGGLDSSLVSALASKYVKNLHTFSIGMEGSPDHEAAKKVAEHIGSTHHVVTLNEEEFLSAIPEVIRVIESWDVTTVRASVGNYLVGKYIRENTPFKVVLNGDYSDEVTGGYLYMKLAPNLNDFRDECCRLVGDIHYFDSLRSDRTISCHGLEARAPFADKAFVQYYLGLDPELTHPVDGKEKHLLRESFRGFDILPDEILFRQKEAFSDGVSSTTRSWFQIIQEKHKDEAEYYAKIFDSTYGKEHRHIIPYKWMPRFMEATDPSARTLKVY